MGRGANFKVGQHDANMVMHEVMRVRKHEAPGVGSSGNAPAVAQGAKPPEALVFWAFYGPQTTL